MEQDIKNTLDQQAVKIEQIYRSVEKTRKMFLWTLIISVAVIVLPLFGMIVLLPRLFSYYGSLTGLGL